VETETELFLERTVKVDMHCVDVVDTSLTRTFWSSQIEPG